MKKALLMLAFAGIITTLSFAQTAGNAPAGALPNAADLALKKKADSISNLPSKLLSITTVRLSAIQSSYATDIKKDEGRDSASVCIAYPNNILKFTISNPLKFLKDRQPDKAHVVIYANGIELKNMCTDWQSAVTSMMISSGKIPPLGNTADIYIQLKRNDLTQDAWNFLYANKPGFFDNYADVDMSIGWENMSALEKSTADLYKQGNTAQANGRNVTAVRIIFYYNAIMIGWVVLLVTLLSGFVYLAARTNTLRDGNMTSVYSLAQSQLMFWTILVVAAFIYTLILTDMPSAFNPSVLLMLGISLGTTGTATYIDSRFKKMNPGVAKPTHGFFRDLLTSDGTNYSVQRIQVFAWNLVLGLYFIIFTITTKSMPVFSSTLLFLAGITSASYVGVKLPENQDLATNPAAHTGGSGANVQGGNPPAGPTIPAAGAGPNTTVNTPSQPIAVG
ncbi:MAG: hypothetical protein M3N14_11320 [Bacteroidota bacterium]|nr:hypothetical protein [Bacteroidota bacterium]